LLLNYHYNKHSNNNKIKI